MDHTVKVWNIGTDDIQDIIEAGSLHTYSQERNFKTHRIHFPVLSSRSIHSNYADCIRCVGNMVLSKSCENQLVFWKPIPKGTEYVGQPSSPSHPHTSITLTSPSSSHLHHPHTSITLTSSHLHTSITLTSSHTLHYHDGEP